jgi:hypothetical protein
MSFFDGARPGQRVIHGATAFDLPILYFRDDCFALFFSASRRAVQALLPSDQLHPVTLPDGRALVGFGAFNYIDTSIGPYGEVAVVVPTVHGHRPLPLVPGLLEAHYPGFGNLVLHLPVTTRTARDAGRGEWGYPKFVADMSFEVTPEYYECRLSEGEQHILTMRVVRQGLITADHKPLVTYSVRGGDLLRTTIPQRGTVRNAVLPGGSSLSLGTHQVAREIGALDLAPRPFMSRYYVERAGMLPAGIVVEQQVRPRDGYRGAEGESAHRVRYGAAQGVAR